MKDKPKSAAAPTPAYAGKAGWWVVKRELKSASIQSEERPKIPPGLSESLFHIVGPFPTKERAEHHRLKITARMFDANNDGRVF